MGELEKLRQELAAIDQELLDQFAKRMRTIEKVAAYKGQTGASIFVPEQEERVLGQLPDQIPPDLTIYARAFLRTLMRLSRERQYQLLLDTAHSPSSSVSLRIQGLCEGSAARSLSLILSILSDLELPLLDLQSLHNGAFHLEFATHPTDPRGMRALHQIQQEAGGIHLLDGSD
ncbi:MAG: chorismate mutase [Limnochordia bacterium]|nr:chorismate mutase [Limnochordia bacterium]